MLFNSWHGRDHLRSRFGRRTGREYGPLALSFRGPFDGFVDFLWAWELEVPIAARLCNGALEFLARSHEGRYVQTAAPPLHVSLGNV